MRRVASLLLVLALMMCAGGCHQSITGGTVKARTEHLVNTPEKKTGKRIKITITRPEGGATTQPVVDVSKYPITN